MNSMWYTQFQQALFDPDLPVPDEIKGTQLIERFSIYRNTVVLGMIEILEQIFPTTKRLLGNEFFMAIASVFVRQYPMRSPVSLEYGEELPAFLRDFPPMADWIWVADVAQLEWLHQQSLNAADSELLNATSLQRMQIEDGHGILLTLDPSLRIARFKSPAFSIWQQQQNVNEQNSFDDPWQPQNILLWRVGSKIRHWIISDELTLFIEALLRGEQLGKAKILAQRYNQEFSFEATLSELFNSQLVVAIETQNNNLAFS